MRKNMLDYQNFFKIYFRTCKICIKLRVSVSFTLCEVQKYDRDSCCISSEWFQNNLEQNNLLKWGFFYLLHLFDHQKLHCAWENVVCHCTKVGYKWKNRAIRNCWISARGTVKLHPFALCTIFPILLTFFVFLRWKL